MREVDYSVSISATTRAWPGSAPGKPPEQPRDLGAVARAPRPGRASGGAVKESGARPGVDPVRAHDAFSARFYARSGGRYGLRPGRDTADRHPGPDMRRLPPHEFRGVRLTRADTAVRRQRLRRNPAGAWEWDVKRLATSLVVAG